MFPAIFPWDERDGLMTFIDQLKYQEFIEDTDKHFKYARIVNFDIIRKEVAQTKLPKETEKYQTIDNSRLGKYPQKKNQILSSAFLCQRKDVFVDKSLSLEHLFFSYSKFRRM